MRGWIGDNTVTVTVQYISTVHITSHTPACYQMRSSITIQPFPSFPFPFPCVLPAAACRYHTYIDTVHTYRTTCLLARGCWSPELKIKSVVESYLNPSPSTHLLFWFCMHECIAYRISLLSLCILHRIASQRSGVHLTSPSLPSCLTYWPATL